MNSTNALVSSLQILVERKLALEGFERASCFVLATMPNLNTSVWDNMEYFRVISCGGFASFFLPVLLSENKHLCTSNDSSALEIEY